jgi:hypothetical protein
VPREAPQSAAWRALGWKNITAKMMGRRFPVVMRVVKQATSLAKRLAKRLAKSQVKPLPKSPVKTDPN